MDKIILLVVVSVLGGIIGGMGMGGGTLLIPLLTVFCGVEQHSAQGLNLVAFLPMSIIVLIIHVKNGLVDFCSVPIATIPALTTSIFASMLALSQSGQTLGRAYGIFLIVLGLYQTACVALTVIESSMNKGLKGLNVTLFKNKF